jgi:peptide/nickel transport system permease protein
VNLGEKYQGPSQAHLLGTDSLGRDLFSRLLVGGRSCLLTALLIVTISIVVGIPLGTLAARKGGLFDIMLMRTYDVILAIPALLLAIIFVAAFGAGAVTSAVAVGITYIPMISRLARSLVSVELGKPYVQALRSLGYSENRIVFREILPNCVPTLLSELTLDFGYAITAMTSLSFLGLGVQAPQSDWGTMIQDGMKIVQLDPLIVLVPTLAVVLVIVSLNMLNDSIQSTIDGVEHKLRRAKTRRSADERSNAVNDADASGSKHLIEISHLSTTILTKNGPTKILDDVSFSVDKTKIVGIVGESGSGKSTLISSILRLNDEKVTAYSGKIEFEGNDVLSLRSAELRRLRAAGISIIFQNPSASMNPLAPVGEQIAERIQYTSQCSRADSRSRAIELLGKVGIAEAEVRYRQYPHELSGGLMQRAMIAYALSSGPKLLLADEPTTALDTTVQAQILDLLRTLRDDLGLSIIIVTHNFGVVAEICDEVHVLHKGRIVESAETSTLFESPRDAYTKELLSALLPQELPGAEDPTHHGAQASPILSISSLSKSYSTGSEDRPQVDNVTLSIPNGSIFGLVGESGSGKTTIGKCILKFVSPSQGSITFRNADLASFDKAALKQFRRDAQMIFQNPYQSFNPTKTLKRAFDEYVRFLGYSDEHEATALIEEKLEAVSLPANILNHLPKEISGGQLQRVVIARALLSKPQFIFADEPVSALDASVQNQVLQLLKDIHEQQHITILLVSHDLAVVEHVCDRVAVMQHGRIVEQGLAGRIFTHPSNAYTKQLLKSRLKDRP